MYTYIILKLLNFKNHFGEKNVKSLVFHKVYIFSSFPDGNWETAYYLLETVTVYPVIKRLISEVDHWRISCIKVKNVWKYASTPPYALVASTEIALLSPLFTNINADSVVWNGETNVENEWEVIWKVADSLSVWSCSSSDLFVWLRSNMKSTEQLASESKCG
jgi:hypothetical protein